MPSMPNKKVRLQLHKKIKTGSYNPQTTIIDLAQILTKNQLLVVDTQKQNNGASYWIRTSDPKLRRLVLYPTELRMRYLMQ